MLTIEPGMTSPAGAASPRPVFDGVRVVELASEVGGYAGKLFADLGADVIHVENADGDPIRRLPPFLGDGSEAPSLTYLYQNTNKRGIAIDLDGVDGQEVFRRLVFSADVFFEAAAPGELERIGLGFDDTRRANPRLTHVSITPFGSDGPYRDRPGSDLICMAAGGMLYLGGANDEKPVLAYGRQAYLMGSLYAAVGALLSLLHRDETGTGQQVDVGMQECVATAMETAAQVWDLEHRIRRAAGDAEAGFGMYRCADGHVFLTAAIGTATHFWTALVDWMEEEGVSGVAELRGDDWIRPDFRRTPSAGGTFRTIFESFTAGHGKQWLYEQGQTRNVICYPVNTPMDVFENPQLQDRRFFHRLDGVTYPGPCYRFETIPWELRHTAPHLGRHGEEILAELGYSSADIRRLVADRAVFV